MPHKHDLLREIIGFILEDDEKDKGNKDADSEDGNGPEGAFQYRTKSGKIVTVPDYVNLPKISVSWDVEDADATATPDGSSRYEDTVKAHIVVGSMTQTGRNRYVSEKYGIQQSQYGTRKDPIDPSVSKDHAGIDITRIDGPTLGVNVIAAEGGTVVKIVTGRSNDPTGGYGNQIIIKHADGRGARYGHLADIYVLVSGSVKAGETIASAGNTGKSTDPHLHFEHITAFDSNNNPRGTEDPRPYLLSNKAAFYPLMPFVKN